jgi:transcriptional regulator with XRE-family HTH domain
MPKYTADAPLQPKGAHNRRLSLGLEPEALAAEAGVTTEQLRDYERTSPDHDYDLDVARLVHQALERLEQVMPNLQKGRSEPGRPNAPVLSAHSQHTRLQDAELAPKILEGAPIYDHHNAEIGKVGHLHGSGPTAQVIIDVGGFLGLGAKPVAVNISQLDFMRDENGHVHALTHLSKHDLEQMPEHSHHH